MIVYVLVSCWLVLVVSVLAWLVFRYPEAHDALNELEADEREAELTRRHGRLR